MDRRASSRGEAAVRVEPMHRRHLREVVRIEKETNPRPWSRALFASELRSPDSRIYVIARSARVIVGYGGVMLVAGDGHVTNVAVAADHRRGGVASRIVVDLARRAIAEGVEAMTLEVRMSNLAAQGLYRRFGFAPAGVRKDYYPPPDTAGDDAGSSDAGEREDALIMWAHDVDGPEYRSRLFEIEAALSDPARPEWT